MSSLPLPGEDPRGEQQRVAGEEEADEQPGLGEDDEPQHDLAVRAQRVDELLDVDAEQRQWVQHGGMLTVVIIDSSIHGLTHVCETCES